MSEHLAVLEEMLDRKRRIYFASPEGSAISLHELNALDAAIALMRGQSEDASRLEWLSEKWGGQRDDYTAHVLRRGGAGDLSDIRTFVDSMRKASSR